MSEFSDEDRELSSVADTDELQMIAKEVADTIAPSGGWKLRVSAISRVLGMEWGRAKSAYYGQVRRVDSYEMDRAIDEGGFRGRTMDEG